VLGRFQIFSWGVRVDFRVVRSLVRRVGGGAGGVVEDGGGGVLGWVMLVVCL
jgi:hypothetical protein